MVFDKKRLQTMKVLDRIAKCSKHSSLEKIMMRNGCMYATDTYVLIEVVYPEFLNDGSLYDSYTWYWVERFMDDSGLLLEKPILTVCIPQFKNDDIFSSHLTFGRSEIFVQKLNLKLLKPVLRVFEINDLKPYIETEENKIYFHASNDDVCIRACIMGCR